jgi:membrane-associated phospholipid phosphatase
MDITYLLFLQDIRLGIHDAGSSFLVGLSTFSVTYLFLIPAFIYWCINKRQGLFVLFSAYLCIAISAVVKLTACVYRPWIRDPRILPVGNSLTRATGYAFPSGHTTTATPIYGGMAYSFWRSKKARWFSILCIITLLLTAFSRNYLGVHTPQDVIVGLALGCGCLGLVYCLFRDLEKHPQHENYYLAAGIIVGILSLIFVIHKSYPLDYVDGKLLVDPNKMMNDAYKDICYLIAFCTARYVEKRWINFTHTGWNLKGIITGVLGLIPAILITAQGGKLCIELLGAHWGRSLYAFIIVFYIMVIYPLVIKCIFQRNKN